MRLMRTIDATMRGILCSSFGDASPSVLKMKCDLPIPKPADSQVLIRIHASGVNPVDTYIRSGNYAALPTLPYTPGKDGAGIVEAVGSRVTGFKKGDRVFSTLVSSGSLAEYGVVDCNRLFPLCDDLSFAEGAALGIPYFTAFRALFQRGGGKRGDVVLIHGASGAVGLAAVQLAAHGGMKVIGTAGTDHGLQLIKENGAEKVYNHKEKGYLEQIKNDLGGPKVNLILEMLANVNLQSDLGLLDVHGKVMIIGCRGSIEINPRLTMGMESSIMGVMLFRATEEEWTEMNEGVQKGMKEGWARPVINKIYQLQDAYVAHQDVIVNDGSKGKIIVNLE